MDARVVIAVLAGLGMAYLALRMMRSSEFTIRLVTAKWNPQGRMYVRILGLDRYVRFNRKVVAPVLLVVSIGLWAIAVWLLTSQGK